jgi:hypothetical protein
VTVAREGLSKYARFGATASEVVVAVPTDSSELTTLKESSNEAIDLVPAGRSRLDVARRSSQCQRLLQTGQVQTGQSEVLQAAARLLPHETDMLCSTAGVLHGRSSRRGTPRSLRR